MKKISVIIPCYNSVKWLPKCFMSLVEQSIGIDNLELIFVNDASTDDGQTWDMLKEMEKAYPESIIIIDLPYNRRQGGARNEGLKYASGEYIAFVDSYIIKIIVIIKLYYIRIFLFCFQICFFV